jgi:hypothetical protein
MLEEIRAKLAQMTDADLVERQADEGIRGAESGWRA